MRTDFKKTRFLSFAFLVALGVFAFEGIAHAQGSGVTCASAAGDPNPYAGLYKDPRVIFDHPQFPEIPVSSSSNWLTTNDNFPVVPNITPCPNGPWMDAVLTYAANLLCKDNAKKPLNPFFAIPNPLPAGMVPTTAQFQAEDDYDAASKTAVSKYSYCMYFVQRRIAYPSTSATGYSTSPAVVSGGTADPITGCPPDSTQAFCQQNVACHNLKDPMAGAASAAGVAAADNAAFGGAAGADTGNALAPVLAGGGGAAGGATPNTSHNINHTGDPELDGALADCDTWGLSEEAQAKIYAYRCKDPNYAGAVLANAGGGAAGEEALDICLEDAWTYDAQVKKDAADFMNIMGLTAPSSASSQNQAAKSP